MVSIGSYYTLLGVSISSSPGEVKAAYFRMARLYHPDKVKEQGSDAPTFVSIRNAYDAIQEDIGKRNEQKKKAEQYSKLASQIVNLIGTIFEDSDSEEDEIDDDYFDRRAKMMDQKYREAHSLFKNPETANKLSDQSDSDSLKSFQVYGSCEKGSESSLKNDPFKDPIRKKTKNL